MSTARERQARRHLPRLWVVPVEFPIEDLGENLTDAEYRKWVKPYPRIKICVHFEYSPAEPEVGIPEESFEWNNDWSLPPIGNYPDRIKSAISAYLDSVDVNLLWGEKAAEMADIYIDRVIYPEL